MTALQLEMEKVLREHDLGDGQRDSRSRAVNFGQGVTTLIEKGGRASAAAAAMADARSGTAIAQAIDSKISAGERTQRWLRLNEAYRLLSAAGIDIE